MSESSLENKTPVSTIRDAPSPAPCHTRIYRTGTLRYTFAALIWLFIWLLWGDFCNTIYSIVFGNFLPLYLHHLRAPDTLMTFLMGGMGGAINVLLLPNLSMWSDRHRGRWGRRIPFLFWSAPVVALALVGIGYTPPLSRWLYGLAAPLHLLSVGAIAMAVVSFMVLVVASFQVVLVNAYQFLFRDVVPQEAMPWFLTLFRVVGVVAGSLFPFFFFRYMVSHPRITCVTTALLFLSSFWLICARVKEGQYPPPPAPPPGDAFRHAMTNYLRYFRECMAVGVYRNFVFVFVLVLAGNAALTTFSVLFATQTLGIGATTYGQILAASTAITGVMYLLVGYICKRWNAMRVTLVSLVLLALAQAGVYFLVYGQTGWLLYSLAASFPGVAWYLGSFIVTMELYPREKFGQLSSSLNTIGYGSLVVTTLVIGRTMDFFDANYRVAFMLAVVCYAVAMLPMYLVYRGWKSHGGPHHYVPPLPMTKDEK